MMAVFFLFEAARRAKPGDLFGKLESWAKLLLSGIPSKLYVKAHVRSSRSFGAAHFGHP